MPTIARAGPYRFFFFSNEGDEPRHVHVQRDEALAKFWLDPVALSSASAFSPREIARLERLIEERRETFRDAWDDFFRA
ncbi:MAG: DUF4160 domain-containing protein [Myxococcota bacterium]